MGLTQLKIEGEASSLQDRRSAMSSPVDRPGPPDEQDFLSGTRALAELVRSKDRSQTPLGALEAWPQSLRTTVSLCLASNFPINIIWGPEHIQTYNNRYRVVCGEVRPRALGEGFDVTWESA
jgi:hypothetical protein